MFNNISEIDPDIPKEELEILSGLFYKYTTLTCQIQERINGDKSPEYYRGLIAGLLIATSTNWIDSVDRIVLLSQIIGKIAKLTSEKADKSEIP